MDKFLIMLLLSFLGLLIGIIISRMAKEELVAGKKYFIILKSIIFSLVLCLFFIYLGLGWISIVPSIVLLTLSYLAEFKVKQSVDMLYYAAFAVVLYELLASAYIAMAAIGIFLFGIATASLESEKLKGMRLFRKAVLISRKGIIFLGIGLLLYIIKP